MLAAFLVFVFLVLCWAAWFFAGVPWEIAATATGIVFALLLLWGIVRALVAWRARASNKPTKPAAREDPLQPVVDQLDQRLQRAVKAIRTFRPGSPRARAIYETPWFLVLGASHSGKTTAVLNGSLRFAEHAHPANAGAGTMPATSTVDVLTAGQLVFIDTPGRYTTDETDRDEWRAVLRVLGRRRPKRPLDGIVIAISAEDLRSTDGGTLAAAASGVRSRLVDLAQILDLRLPIYVLVTKCDILGGFESAFDTLSEHERGTPWGFTLPLSQTDYDTAFHQEFQLLSARLEAHCMARLATVRELDQRVDVYALPQRFDRLRTQLHAYVSSLIAREDGQEPPLLRGLYFSSGTQLQSDRSMGRSDLSSTLATGSFTAGSLGKLPRGYFLDELFARILSPDNGMATPTRRRVRRDAIRQASFGAAMTAAGVLLTVVAVSAFNANSALLVRTGEALNHVAAGKGALRRSRIAALAPLEAVHSELRSPQHDALALGMNQHGVLEPPARRLKGRLLLSYVAEPTVTYLDTEMAAFIQDASDHDEQHFAEIEEMLATYVQLTRDPLAAPSIEESVDDEQREWLADHLRRYWSKIPALRNDTSQDHDRDALINAYVELTLQHGELPFESDTQLIRDVRAKLGSARRYEKLVDALVAKVRERARPVRLGDLLRSDIAGTWIRQPESTPAIPGAYTREGWHVVHDELSRHEQPARGHIRSLYLKRYIETWRRFIATIFIEVPDSRTDTIEMFRALQADPPPLQQLLIGIDEHTNLPDPTATAPGTKIATKAKQTIWERFIAPRLNEIGQDEAVMGSEVVEASEPTTRLRSTQLDRKAVHRSFKGLVRFAIPPPAKEGEEPEPTTHAMSAYLGELATVEAALTELDAAPDDPQLAANLADAIARSISSVDTLLVQQDRAWTSRLRSLIRPPFDAVDDDTRVTAGVQVSKAWCAEVYAPYLLALSEYYPFNPNADQEVSLTTFNEFFAPEVGLVWQFYNGRLHKHVAREGRVYRPRPNAKLVVTSDMIEFLDQAQRITDTMYPRGSDPGFEFEVRIADNPSGDTTFAMNGQRAVHRNGPPKPRRIQWPGDGKEAGASYSVKGRRGHVERTEQLGTWGLFRLLEHAEIEPSTSGSQLTVRWKATIGEVKMILTSPIPTTPVYGPPDRPVTQPMGIFRGVHPPSRLSRRSTACPTATAPDEGDE